MELLLILGLVLPMVFGLIGSIIWGINHKSNSISHAIFFCNNLKRLNHEVKIGDAIKHFKLADEFKDK